MFGKLKQLTHERRQQGIDVIDLGMGNPDRPTPQHIVDKLTEAAQEGQPPSLLCITGNFQSATRGQLVL